MLDQTRLSNVIVELPIPEITDEHKHAIARRIHSERFNQLADGDLSVLAGHGDFAFHVIAAVPGGPVLAAWYRSAVFAASLIWPAASYFCYRSGEAVLKFTEVYLKR